MSGGYHGSVSERRDNAPAMTRWWLVPVLIGAAGMGAALLLGDFRPVVERFYSVF